VGAEVHDTQDGSKKKDSIVLGITESRNRGALSAVSALKVTGKTDTWTRRRRKSPVQYGMEGVGKRARAISSQTLEPEKRKKIR